MFNGRVVVSRDFGTAYHKPGYARERERPIRGVFTGVVELVSRLGGLQGPSTLHFGALMRSLDEKPQFLFRFLFVSARTIREDLGSDLCLSFLCRFIFA